jgi:hypothetical protein
LSKRGESERINHGNGDRVANSGEERKAKRGLLRKLKSLKLSTGQKPQRSGRKAKIIEGAANQ